MDDDSAADDQRNWGKRTYGNCAPLHISTNQLTADQHRILLPRVETYVTMDGAERKNYVLQVRVCLVSSAYPFLTSPDNLIGL